MSDTKVISTMVIALLLLSQSVVFAKGQSDSSVFYFDCDSTKGRFSESIYNSNDSIQFVNASLSFKGVKRHSKWDPVATLSLRDQDSTERVSIQLTKDRKSKSVKSVLNIGPQKRTKSYVLKEGLSVGDTLEFSLYLNEEKDAIILIEGDEQGIEIPFSKNVSQISMSCSTSWAVLSVNKVEFSKDAK